MEHHPPAGHPPIPTRTQSTQRHGTRRTSLSSQATTPNQRSNAAPTSPEVISNLISSLSVISRPTSSYFEAHPTATHSRSVPTSPDISSGGSGSFGVDYGAYTSHRGGLEGVTEEPLSLDDLAASPPVIRTSKPPSGFSPLTAPKTPSRESGLRSFMRGSSSANHSPRPSSPGSAASRNDDTQSIGNVSIERGRAPTPELHRRKSTDSWGKKTGRSAKGLMYMSSRERLKEKDYEKRRSLGGESGTSGPGSATMATGRNSNHSGGRGDPFLAETAIREEPLMPHDQGSHSVQAVPARESSLKASKRSSGRKSRRDADGPPSATIVEADERPSWPKRDSSRKVPDAASSLDPYSFLSHAAPDAATASPSRQVYESSHLDEYKADALDDDGAPFPAVSQGRKREDQSADRSGRRRSGRQSPGADALKVKRSSSRLKNFSGQLSPPTEEGDSEPASDGQRQPAGYERPQSADSVDDAVGSYLCSPRLSQKIKHPQTGRVISFSEVGDANGSAVFCCVGMGLTRYIMAFYDELALTLKLRLITPDRPGVGDSEAYSDGTATPLSWPDDVYAICQALKITKFSILAHSAGAIYALATALRMPQHIRGRIHLLAPWIPPSQMTTFGTAQSSPPTNSMPTSQRILRALPTPILKAANSSFMTATSSSVTSSLPKTSRRSKKKSSNAKDAPVAAKKPIVPAPEQENMGHNDLGREAAVKSLRGDMPQTTGSHHRQTSKSQDGEAAILAAAADALADRERQMTYDTRLTHAIWDLATTGANPAVDLLVCLERRHTIGFRYVDITRPVVVHHGSRDTRVPVDNVRWLGKTMKRCEVRVLEGEGHGLMASAGVMGAVLMEISKEWEDWMRVTGADGRKERERGRRGTIGKS